MILKISVGTLVALLLLPTLATAAAATVGQEQAAPRAAKPAGRALQIQKAPSSKAPVDRSAHTQARPTFKMTCPDAADVTLHISYVSGGWALNPYELQPQTFTRAYARIDPADKSRVTLACLYQVTADYVAKTSYNGLQQCYCNPTTGEGMVKYTGPAGYTANIAGTSARGNLPVRKTGQQVQDQMLECQFHLDGEAQLFKKHTATGNVSECQASGREVTCLH